MLKYLLLGLGGGIGTILRYLVYTVKWSDRTPFDLLTATLIVNLLGSLLIGFAWGIFGTTADERVRQFLFIGIFGGFTTFSTFAFENFQLIKTNQIAHTIIYITLSCVGGVLLVWLGHSLGKLILRA